MAVPAPCKTICEQWLDQNRITNSGWKVLQLYKNPTKNGSYCNYYSVHEQIIYTLFPY